MAASRTTRLRDYLTIAEAATLLGVSASTLRNWDRSGKLRAHRHPLNNYRLYEREDLEALLHQVNAELHEVKDDG